MAVTRLDHIRNSQKEGTFQNTLLFLVTFLFCMPSVWAVSAVAILRRVVIVVIACYFMTRKDFRFSGFSLVIALYFLVSIFSNYINQSSYFSSVGLFNYFSIWVMAALIEYALKERNSGAILALALATVPLALVDVGSVILYPDGMYYTVEVQNAYYTKYSANWLYGNQNNHASIFLVSLLTLSLATDRLNQRAATVIAAIAFALLEGTVLFLASSTSSVSVLIAGAGCVLFTIRKLRRPLGDKFLLGVFVIYLAFNFLLVSGSFAVFGDLISAIFGKDASFSDRSYLWNNAMQVIGQKPIFGWGQLDNDTAATILGGIEWVNAHNQLLNTAFFGGIVLLALLIILFFVIVRPARFRKCRPYQLICVFFLIALFVECSFEQLLGANVIWVGISICYALSCGSDNQGKHVAQVIKGPR